MSGGGPVQALSIAGALLILVAYAGSQFGFLDPARAPYIVMNLVGAGALTIVAWKVRQWGFLILEGVWTLVSAVSLIGLRL